MTRLSLWNSVKITQPKKETYGRYSIKHQWGHHFTMEQPPTNTNINIDIVTESDTKVKDSLKCSDELFSTFYWNNHKVNHLLDNVILFIV